MLNFHCRISSIHQQFLDPHCRVCGKRFGKGKYDILKYREVAEIFNINPESDCAEVHPKCLCNSCYLTAKRISLMRSKGGVINTQKVPIKWLPHDDINCQVCTVKVQGGKTKKTTAGGRPTILEQHIKTIAGTIPSSQIS